MFRQYPWMARTGQPVGQRFGYIADGLFQAGDQIATSPTIVGYKPQAGDIKYKDLNGDGIINQFDESAIGNRKPQIMFGGSVGVRWGSFDASALVQGVVNRNIYRQGNSVLSFQNNGFGPAFEQHLDRWTPTNPTARIPRLSVGQSVINRQTSSYWARSGDYLRLKNIEIGYTLPTGLVSRVKLQSVRIFANGTNVLTLNKEKRIDPEALNELNRTEDAVKQLIELRKRAGITAGPGSRYGIPDFRPEQYLNPLPDSEIRKMSAAKQNPGW